jgi:multiple antibiotic resistance protein
VTTLSATVLLFLVMDPVGNSPVFLSLLSGLDPSRARIVLARELTIALGVLVAFLFAGRHILDILQITEPALSISGGIILFRIALKMIFADVRDVYASTLEGEPFVAPLAVPLIAGPSAMAKVLLLRARQTEMWLSWLFALLLAWLAAGAILFFASSFERILGRRGIAAIQRLFGRLLTTVSVQMFLSGIGGASPWNVSFDGYHSISA